MIVLLARVALLLIGVGFATFVGFVCLMLVAATIGAEDWTTRILAAAALMLMAGFEIGIVVVIVKMMML